MKRRLQLLIAWLAILGAWEVAFRVFQWPAWQFPAPSHVIDSTLSMIGVNTRFGDPFGSGWPTGATQQGSTTEAVGTPKAVLPYALLVSIVRVVIGFAISIVFGLFLGAVMWRFRFMDELLGPVFLGLQTLPSVCWVPLAVLTLGINESAIILVLVLGSAFACAIAMRDGMRMIPPIYHRAGLMLSARRWNLYRYVLLPASLPAMASSLRQGFSFAWRSLMGAELILVLENRGVGFLLAVGRDFADVAQVVSVMIIMVVIGMTADRLIFARIENAVRTRFGLIGTQ